MSDYFAHGQVTNVGPGLKLAIGLRPSKKALLAMLMTALLPFYESPVDTTGVALCNLSPAVSMFLKTVFKLVKLRVNGLLSKSATGAAASLSDADANRARSWWSEKYFNQSLKSRNSEEDADGIDATPGVGQGDLPSKSDL